MSRAIRRQQAATPKERPQRRTPSFGGKRPQPTRGAKPPATQKRRLRVPSWFEDITSELRKVTWPTREDTIYLTTVVIIVSIAVGIALGGIDIFFNWFIDRLLLR